MSGVILLALRFAATALLYGFLAWALWLLWQDVRKRSRALAEANVPPLLLIPPAEIGQARRLTQPDVVIGRDPACECTIDDPTISARHARLSYHHGQWWIEDLHSRNGTMLNQQVVNEMVVLTSGDILQFGRVVFQVKLGDLFSTPESLI